VRPPAQCCVFRFGRPSDRGRKGSARPGGRILNLTPLMTQRAPRTGCISSVSMACLVQDVIGSLCANRLGAQPDYLYALAQEEQEPVNSDHMPPEKAQSFPRRIALAKGSKVPGA